MLNSSYSYYIPLAFFFYSTTKNIDFIKIHLEAQISLNLNPDVNALILNFKFIKQLKNLVINKNKRLSF